MGETEEASRGAEDGPIARLAGWFDTRLGLSYQLLRPAPQYAINPFNWLGALAVFAFVIQGDGYVDDALLRPDPSQAYSSTQIIFQNVSYGSFLESVHLYTAYAMIMLAFMHMMRGYFISAHKKPLPNRNYVRNPGEYVRCVRRKPSLGGQIWSKEVLPNTLGAELKVRHVVILGSGQCTSMPIATTLLRKRGKTCSCGTH